MDFQKLRDKMVDEQIIARGVRDKAVIKAMRELPRHMFIPSQEQESAYGDHPVVIGEGQTISQPYIVALMSQELKLKSSDRVLEIGTGSGYQTAILARIAKEVCTIERIEPLSREARRKLEELGIGNVKFYVGDGTEGIDEGEGTFDAIIITAATPQQPRQLYKLLNEDGGRLLAPIGPRYSQVLTRFTRQGEQIEQEEICGCVFVPLIGKYGYQHQ